MPQPSRGAMGPFDPWEPSVQDDPFPFFEVLRRDAPVWRDPQDRFVAISRYDDVRTVLHTPEVFSNTGGFILGQDVSAAPPSMVLMDPPDHTRLRGLVSRAFTPRRIAEFEDGIRAAAGEFTDDFADRLWAGEEVDLVPEFADLVPVRAISDIVGVPRSERAWFRERADLMIGDAESEAGVAALLDCFSYFSAALEERNRSPRDDVLTALTQAEIDGERLSLDEQVGMILLLFFAGIETTVFHFSNVVWYLGIRGDLQRGLRDDPSLLPAAMEEILRFDPPVLGDKRTVVTEHELRGQTLHEGDVAFPLIGSANRDPDVFDRPDELDITRSPNPHLTFAAGPHFCLGAPLVRLEHRVALEELLARVPPYRVEPERARRRHLHGPFMRGMSAVPAVLAT